MAADLIFTGGRIYTVLPDERRMVPATARGEAASSEDTSDGAGIGAEDGPPATAVAVQRRPDRRGRQRRRDPRPGGQ